MKIEIIEERENPLLNRRELRFKVLHDAATPSRKDVKDKLTALLNVKKETVILDSFTSRYGLKESVGTARVYKSQNRAREVESKFLIDKNLGVKKAEEKSEDKAEKEKQGPKKPEAEAAPKPVDKTEEKAHKKKTVTEEKPSPKKPEKEEKKPKEK